MLYYLHDATVRRVHFYAVQLTAFIIRRRAPLNYIDLDYIHAR